jgi:hypothetical protein
MLRTGSTLLISDRSAWPSGVYSESPDTQDGYETILVRVTRGIAL